MKLKGIIDNAGDRLCNDGPHDHIVVSSRVRLARNLASHPFPGWAKKAERMQILEILKQAVEALPEMKDRFAEYLQDLTPLEKQVLVERHLISREHAAKGAGSAVVMNRQQTLSIMVNEEDHLRMQALRPGLQLAETYKMVDVADSGLEQKLDYAFHQDLGYLTACPTNVGTGMRASAMLHLPALVISEQINKIINSVNKIGLAVRGLYGEGTEAMGNIFQISNQTTLGETEEESIERLNKVVLQVIEHEQNARQTLLQRKAITLLDQIGRAFGILNYAHSMSSKEALNLLSIIKLGIDLGIFPETSRLPVDELFMETQPAHLQKGTSQLKLPAEERDTLRAEIVRAKLKNMSDPDISNIKVGEETHPPKNDE
ncbi:MAG: protein arginine kinase [Chthoniobacterales bacterium]